MVTLEEEWEELEEIVLRPEGEEGQDEEGEEGGPGPLRECVFPLSFVDISFAFPLSIFYRRIRGERERDAPPWRHGNYIVRGCCGWHRTGIELGNYSACCLVAACTRII